MVGTIAGLLQCAPLLTHAATVPTVEPLPSRRDTPRLLPERLPRLTLYAGDAPGAVLHLDDMLTGSTTDGPARYVRLIPPLKRPGQGGAKLSLVDGRIIHANPTQEWLGVERWIVEVSDGRRTDQAVLQVQLRRRGTGEIIESDDPAVRRGGDWIAQSDHGTDFLQAATPGAQISVHLQGRTSLTARLFSGPRRLTERFHEGKNARGRYHFLGDWNVFEQGSARVQVVRLGASGADEEARPPKTIDLHAERGRWTEQLIADDLQPDQSYRVTLEVVEGYVSLDWFRTSRESLVPVQFDAGGLADVLFDLHPADGSPPVRFRTDRYGRYGPTYGLRPGRYQVESRADSGRGYAGQAVEERLNASTFEVDVPHPDRPTALTVIPSRIVFDDAELNQSWGLRPAVIAPVLLTPGGRFCLEQAAVRPDLAGFEPIATQAWLDGPNGPLSLAVSAADHCDDPSVPVMRIAFPEETAVTAHWITLPADAPLGLWPLQLARRKVRGALQIHSIPRAVALFEQPIQRYRFIQITDLHLRGAVDDRKHLQRVLDLLDEIHLLDPAFVLVTGDLTETGARPEYLRFLDLLARFEVPTFSIPGNHDHYTWNPPYRHRGRDHYRALLGSGTYALELFGDRFLALDTSAYEKLHAGGAGGNAWGWLEDQLRRAEASRPRLLGVFAHYDYTRDLPEDHPLYRQLENRLAEAGVDLFLTGHAHTNRVDPEHSGFITTGSTIDGHYRVFEVDDDGNVRHHALRRGALRIAQALLQDGVTTTATVENRSGVSWSGLRLRLDLACASEYDVQGASLDRLHRIKSDDAQVAPRCRVELLFDSPAGQRREVRIRPIED